MRKLILGLGISLDGYIARPNGSVDFLFQPKDYSMAKFMASVDTAILGRKTFDAAKKMGGSFSGWKTTFYVMSRKKSTGKRDGVTFTRKSPAALLKEIRKRPGKHIWHMGGGELARAFLKADLIDEIYLGVVPVILGSGIPLFPAGFPQRDLILVENQTFSRGLISLTYKRIRGRSRRKR